jgi:hypothetical protein
MVSFASIALLFAPGMLDVTDAIGLGPDVIPEVVPRICFADLNNDDWPDLVVNRHRVFLNSPDSKSPIGRRFTEKPSNLTPTLTGTATVFADLDNDGKLDAVVSESCQPDDPKWQDHGRRTRWQRGNGDGTFQAEQPLPVPPRPTIAIAVGDLNLDGRLDLFFANSYKAGDTYEGFPGDLLMSADISDWRRSTLPDERISFNDDTDPGARPTYGAMMLSLDHKRPMIYELSYGRRWNRLWIQENSGWVDRAPQFRLDGDFIRHGVYPAWLLEIAKTRPQFPTKPEKPFRANGNSFDAGIGDVDNDGRLDLLTTEITQAWAGESSDRSRVLFQGANLRFATRPGFSFDRSDASRSWNQGDLFGELADMDADGKLDLILSAGDYPDQWLRIYLQRSGKLVEAQDAFAAKHDGSQQISLGDVDGDGAPDLAVGQTFNRLNAEQIGGRKPHLRLFANRMAVGRKHWVLRLRGDGQNVNRFGLGATVRAVDSNGVKHTAQLVGIGGHAGKQHDFMIHFGLDNRSSVRSFEVVWPDRKHTVQRFNGLPAGHYRLKYGQGRPERIL